MLQCIGGLDAEPSHGTDVGRALGQADARWVGPWRLGRRGRDRGGERQRGRPGCREVRGRRLGVGGHRVRRSERSGDQAVGQFLPGPGWSRRGHAVPPDEVPDAVEEAGQRLAVDELHGVVVHAPLAADGVDRHDVCVVQQPRGLRLLLEPLQVPLVEHGRQRQHLQGHAAAERELLGLIDHPHAAAAHLTDQVEVAQHVGHRVRDVGRGSPWPGRVGRGPAQAGHRLHCRQAAAQHVGVLGMAAGVVLQVYHLARGQPVGQLVDQSFQSRVGRRSLPVHRCGH